ncbi:MAG: hypothetical protein JNK04_05735, partial [Myxococcales bacterium]|nr:hypothetical protein [Myxococcales bacterium]
LLTNAFDHARLLEATQAPAAEVEAHYRLAMMPYAEEVVGFEKVLARARLALILERQKKQDAAARIRADLARMLAHADPKVRELVEKP